jgi:ubiquinone/menaquinone biosynthesis methyltransferases
MFMKLDRPATLDAASQEQFVHKIFSAIACRYDRLNSILCFNSDVGWRRYAVAKACVSPGDKALDLCCGTGKLTLELAKAVGDSGRVVGVDFCGDMLQIACKNILPTRYGRQVAFIEANVLQLPFADDSFDCCTIGFGLRNVADVPGALHEFSRVLKPGGRLVILELGNPEIPVFKNLYWFYFGKVLPLIGQSFAGVKGAYQWLPESLRRFPQPREVVALLKRIGFKAVGCDRLTGGIVAVYFCEK